VFQTADVAPCRADVSNYMASVQSLSALADNHAVTSLPPSSAAAPAPHHYVPPTVASYDQFTIGGHRFTESGPAAGGYCQPAQWQYSAQLRWNVNGYAGAVVSKR